MLHTLIVSLQLVSISFRPARVCQTAFAPPVVLDEQARPGLDGHYNDSMTPDEPMQAYANLVNHLQVTSGLRCGHMTM